jgi:hypothetical protein
VHQVVDLHGRRQPAHQVVGDAFDERRVLAHQLVLILLVQA